MLDSAALGFEYGPLLAAFAIGLLGGAHCIGMCGGLMAALSFSVPAQQPLRRLQIIVLYNLGRIASYTLIGALAGWLGYHLTGAQGVSVLRVVAALLLLAMGLYIGGWWQGLVYLERLGGVFWKPLQPLAKRLMPVRSGSGALLLGALWGWLPCGLVYTALAYGLAQASAPAAAGVMLAFGLGTLPVMLAAGVLAARLQAVMRQRGFRSAMAVCILAFGGWTLWAALLHGSHDSHGSHGSHEIQEAREVHEGPQGHELHKMPAAHAGHGGQQAQESEEDTLQPDSDAVPSAAPAEHSHHH